MVNIIPTKQLGRFFMNRIGLRLGGKYLRTTREELKLQLEHFEEVIFRCQAMKRRMGR
jgi:hypothetical protein